jgi:hypothetical protein
MNYLAFANSSPCLTLARVLLPLLWLLLLYPKRVESRGCSSLAKLRMRARVQSGQQADERNYSAGVQKRINGELTAGS